MDFTTIIGFILGCGLLFFGATEGGNMKIFLNFHGLSIVVGGTLAMTLVNTSAKTLWETVRACLRLFFPKRETSIAKAIPVLRQLAEQAKANGAMALQGADKNFAGGFLGRALNVGLTSGDPEFTRAVLEEDILQMRLRHSAVQNVLRTAGVLSPMLGLLGTLIGIVSVLQQISDPSKVGPAMATALSTAFYGILVASFFAVPVAGKLRERSNQESMLEQLVIEAVVGILKNEAPYLLEVRLRSFAMDKGTPATNAPAPQRRVA